MAAAVGAWPIMPPRRRSPGACTARRLPPWAPGRQGRCACKGLCALGCHRGSLTQQGRFAADRQRRVGARGRHRRGLAHQGRLAADRQGGGSPRGRHRRGLAHQGRLAGDRQRRVGARGRPVGALPMRAAAPANSSCPVAATVGALPVRAAAPANSSCPVAATVGFCRSGLLRRDRQGRVGASRGHRWLLARQGRLAGF